jgi:hypothetical protein
MSRGMEDFEPLKNSASLPHWRIVTSQSRITPRVLSRKYKGSGTDIDPYLVDWIHGDPGNPMTFAMWKKWLITLLVAFSTFAMSFASSAYTGGIRQIINDFDVSEEVVILGISLFVIGFAIGPLIWAPLSELYGRQKVFVITYGIFVVFNAGTAGSNSVVTLIVLRFFAACFGSSVLTLAGGVVADLFP